MAAINIIKPSGFRLFLIVLVIPILSLHNKAMAQDKSPYVRIANIEVDSSQLENYKTALKENAQASVNKEPGVLTLYAVYDKEKATHITVFEIYASKEAYQSHVHTEHFLKYKATVKDMVKSLVLTDVVPIALETKHR